MLLHYLNLHLITKISIFQICMNNFSINFKSICHLLGFQYKNSDTMKRAADNAITMRKLCVCVYIVQMDVCISDERTDLKNLLHIGGKKTKVRL